MDLDYQYKHSPFDELLGLRLEEASGDRVVGVVPVTAELHENHGIVHAGVYSTAVEANASVGADLWLGAAGRAGGTHRQAAGRGDPPRARPGHPALAGCHPRRA